MRENVQGHLQKSMFQSGLKPSRRFSNTLGVIFFGQIEKGSPVYWHRFDGKAIEGMLSPYALNGFDRILRFNCLKELIQHWGGDEL